MDRLGVNKKEEQRKEGKDRWEKRGGHTHQTLANIYAMGVYYPETHGIQKWMNEYVAQKGSTVIESAGRKGEKKMMKKNKIGVKKRRFIPSHRKGSMHQ